MELVLDFKVKEPHSDGHQGHNKEGQVVQYDTEETQVNTHYWAYIGNRAQYGGVYIEEDHNDHCRARVSFLDMQCIPTVQGSQFEGIVQ